MEIYRSFSAPRGYWEVLWRSREYNTYYSSRTGYFAQLERYRYVRREIISLRSPINFEPATDSSCAYILGVYLRTSHQRHREM